MERHRDKKLTAIYSSIYTSSGPRTAKPVYGKPNVPAETLDSQDPRSQLLDDTLYT
jgi:hypothetical protein